MAIADALGLPVAVGIASASPHEITLVEETLDNAFIADAIRKLIGDRAYDSDGLDERLIEERDVELIAAHRSNRRTVTQDGRPLRRTKRRWKVERLFAWLHSQLPPPGHALGAPRGELPGLRPARLHMHLVAPLLR
jgi:transposase